MGALQPRALPDTLDPLVVDCPARLAQECGDLAIATAAVLPGKLDNIGRETLLVVTTARDLALCRAMLVPTGRPCDFPRRSDLVLSGDKGEQQLRHFQQNLRQAVRHVDHGVVAAEQFVDAPCSVGLEPLLRAVERDAGITL